MALLEVVCHCGGGLLGIIYAQATHSKTDYFLLPFKLRCKYSQVLLRTIFPACGLASHYENNGLNFLTVISHHN